MMKKTGIWMVGLALSLLVSPAFGQYGIFDQTADWSGRGKHKVEGSAEYNNGVYTLKGNGDDIWDEQDEGFYVYTERSGSWSLQGKVAWVDSGGGNQWAKVGVMIRENAAEPGSRQYWSELRFGTNGSAPGDRADTQWRNFADHRSFTHQLREPNGHPVRDPGEGLWLRVTRLADRGVVYTHYSHDGVDWTLADHQIMPMQDSVAYGLAISNHEDNQQLAEAIVTDVTLTQAVVEDVPTVMAKRQVKYWQHRHKPANVELNFKAGVVNESVTVVETPPAGWEIDQVSHDGVVDNGSVTWTLGADELTNGAAQLSYSLFATNELVSQEYIFDGVVDNEPVGGDEAMYLLDIAVTRSLSPEPFKTGEMGTVTLSIQTTGEFNLDSLAIQEHVPGGLKPDEISEGGEWNAEQKKIRWFLFDQPDEPLTYTVKLGDKDHYNFWSGGHGHYYFF
ncbi:hypothetical protein GF373_07345, partial [bacterium]|nr:hypothetical protein [bacterium]